MPQGRYNSSLTRVQPFFEQAFAIDQRGATWLPKLLAAAPRGKAVFGELLDAPGDILAPLLGPHPSGTAPRACFEYRIPAPVRFLQWCIDHPDRLTWPPGATYSPKTTLMRRALLYDEPPGRAQAQADAHRLLRQHGPRKNEWWRFEGESSVDCFIATDRITLTIEGKRTDVLSPATDWYPRRTQLVRNLEAARERAKGPVWGTLLISEEPVTDAGVSEVAASLDDAAPHLADSERAQLQAAYLGNITWRHACDAIGLDFGSLPNELATADA